jgi:putative Holliday junction resolvase
MRHLGLDVGDRRIGMALSDETATLATALPTFLRVGPRKDVQRIAELVREHGAGAVVVGLPLNMDGSRGPQAEKVLRFCADLRSRTKAPVFTQDERLTTVEAEEILAARGIPWRERKGLVDAVAATVILQEYLDRRRSICESSSSS